MHDDLGFRGLGFRGLGFRRILDRGLRSHRRVALAFGARRALWTLSALWAFRALGPLWTRRQMLQIGADKIQPFAAIDVIHAPASTATTAATFAVAAALATIDAFFAGSSWRARLGGLRAFLARYVAFFAFATTAAATATTAATATAFGLAVSVAIALAIAISGHCAFGIFFVLGLIGLDCGVGLFFRHFDRAATTAATRLFLSLD